MKLRKRNLGPILDANGWAVNARAKMNVPFGKSLTQVRTLPPGAKRDLTDPFAEKKSPWPAIIIFLLLLAGAYGVLNYLGFIHQWTQGHLGHARTTTTTSSTSSNSVTHVETVTSGPAAVKPKPAEPAK